jgi:alkanesulfonate monooxygenase SsuD/methylene tetrahydromethanopterin reductase-like flavin-dependent oxidoreductase (luciferase family)
MVLASIASRTEKIRLGSAVTVLSSDDPVRVYQRFATLDAASNGRAEVILGRGSFTESFPLFGLDLAQYDELFEEKLNLFVELMKEQEVTWSGSTRASVAGPASLPDHRVGFPEGLGWSWWKPGVRGESGSLRPPAGARHHRGRPPSIPSVHRPVPPSPHGVRTWGAADRRSLPGIRRQSDEEAREELWPYYKEGRDRIGASRGWPPVTRAQFDQEASADGSLYIGSVETVAAKIARTVASLDIDRFDLKYSSGRLPHEKLMRNIELYGTQVVPMVRELLAQESELLAG